MEVVPLGPTRVDKSICDRTKYILEENGEWFYFQVSPLEKTLAVIEYFSEGDWDANAMNYPPSGVSLNQVCDQDNATLDKIGNKSITKPVPAMIMNSNEGYILRHNNNMIAYWGRYQEAIPVSYGDGSVVTFNYI